MGGFYILIGSILEKCGKFWKNCRFFRADLAGLGKCRTGGFGRIGVNRVKQVDETQKQLAVVIQQMADLTLAVLSAFQKSNMAEKKMAVLRR